MVKRILVVLVIAVAIIGSASQSLSAQSTPPRPLRDLDTGQLSIAPVPAQAGLDEPRVTAQAAPLQVTGMAEWSKLTYQSYVGGWDIFAANGDGTNPVRLTSAGAPDITPRFNRGATRVAYASSEPGNYEIYTINPNGSGKTRVTNNAANDYNPAWSPDGAKLIFNTYRDGQSEIYVMNANGTNPVRLTYNAAYEGQSAWSPDGTKIAFLSDRSGSGQIWVMNADGSGVTQLTTQSYSEDAAWSPDGTQIAYDADADGDGWQELMIVNADGTNPQVIGDTNTTADMWARSWSPDGRLVAITTIYYVYYQGNWYWTAAYSQAVDAVTYGLYSLGGSNVDWLPDWQTTDLLPPTSSMTALPATSPSPITVKWSGADAGPAGILGYDVQVKDGAGAWTTWLTHTAQTAVGYPGIGGHTYSFRVRAVDNSSNLQAWPVNAQTSTTVESLPPTTVVAALPAQSPAQFVVTWSGSDPGGSDIASYDIQSKADTDLDWQDWRTNVTATSTAYTGVGGHTYYFRARARDRAGNLEDWPANPDALTTVENLVPVSSIIPLPDYARGTLAIHWQGYDPGGSGIGQYDVQYSDAADGLWHDWQIGTATTEAEFAGTAGHTYAFRVQAVDRAQNQATWSLTTEDTSVTFYTWRLSGQVFDTRHVPVPDVNLIISPTVLNLTASGSNGRYESYAARAGSYTVQPSQTGYGAGQVMSLSLASDLLADHVLPPLANQIRNGGFEDPADFLAEWTEGGTVSPTPSLPHTGQAGVTLKPDTLPRFGITETVGTMAPQRLDTAIDQTGVLHVVYETSNGLFYARRDVSGTWSTSVQIAASGSYPSVAVTAAGEVHVVWQDFSLGVVLYARLPVSGVWTSPVAVDGGIRSDVAVDTDGSVHVVYVQSIAIPYGWVNMVSHRSRLPNGIWSVPEPLIPMNGWDKPLIAIGPGHRLHVIIDLSDMDHGMWGYHCTRTTGDWQCAPTPVYSRNSCITVDLAGTLHWLTWDTVLGQTYYLKKPVGQPFSLEPAPNSALYACDIAVDSVGRVVQVDSGATLWLKTLDGEWYGPVPIEASSPIDPHVEVGPDDSLLLTYGTDSGPVNQTRLPKTTAATSSIDQLLTVPSDLHSPTLSFLYQLAGGGRATPGRLRVSVTNDVTSVVPFATSTNTPQWTQGWVDMSAWAGQTVTVSFAAAVSDYFQYTTATLDEVSLGSWLTPYPQAIVPGRIEAMSFAALTISGDNFVPGSSVWLNSTHLTDTGWISTTLITATIPALPFGRHDLSVKNPDGQAGSLPYGLLVGYEVVLPIVRK